MKIDLITKTEANYLDKCTYAWKLEGGGGVKRRERRETVFSYKYVQLFLSSVELSQPSMYELLI